MWHVLSFSGIALISLLFAPQPALAQTAHQDLEETVRAEVVSVEKEYDREIVGTDSSVHVQELRVTVKEGARAGDIVDLTSEIVQLSVGDTIYVHRTVDIEGVEYFTFADFERRPVLFFVAILFAVILLVFSQWQGLRALISLGVSVAAILFLLVPALLAGYDATLTTIGVAAAVLAISLFGTHGINPRSVIAFGGTYATVIVTGLIAYFAVAHMRLSGLNDDAAVYLNFATNGELDLAGLLLGSIIVGILGALDDVSITQVSIVQELKNANPKFKFRELYARAAVVGRNHIGSMVNTLALAYASVSLPLILLYAKTESQWWLSLNQEVVASELLRIVVGSIGLVLAVPATTAVAAWFFQDRVVLEEDLDEHDHGHHHG
ncbi:MAG: YibE/F family protein [Patescibacteria group bacterium]